MDEKKKEREFSKLIHIIRGQQVILDSDLARLYGTEVNKLNQQVKRNIQKFPNDFMFQLTKDEDFSLLKSQNVTSSHGGKRKLTNVFTEQGVYMVATILKNDIATQQSIYIMRSFKEMKHYLAENKTLLNNTDILRLSTTVMQNKEDIQKIKSVMATRSDIHKIIDNFMNEDKLKEITFLEGQKFEANEAYIKIYKQAEHTIYIIDNYVNLDTLSLLKYKHKNVDVIIFTANKAIDKLHPLEVHNFQREYPTLSIKKTRGFHDRYIILDYGTSNEMVYHCGHSSKDTGNKISTIHKMLDKEVLSSVIDKLLANSDDLFNNES